MKIINKIWIYSLSLSIVLTACKLPARSYPTSQSTDAYAVFTSAALTAEAKQIVLSTSRSTPQPESLIKTVVAPPQSTGGALITPTSVDSPVSNISATALEAKEGDWAEFVEDVTVPDGSEYSPGESFIKTWRLRNVGTTTWTTTYTLAFVNGHIMGGTPAVIMPHDVPPGGVVDISINLVAPTMPGGYRGHWMLKNEANVSFGVGEGGDQTIWVDILVSDSVAVITSPNAVGEDKISNVSLTVDAAVVNVDCSPDGYTFIFEALFTSHEDSTLTYRMEITSGEAGIKIRQPPPETRNYIAGAHSKEFKLTFYENISGLVQFHIIEPEDILSNQVRFSLTCN